MFQGIKGKEYDADVVGLHRTPHTYYGLYSVISVVGIECNIPNIDKEIIWTKKVTKLSNLLFFQEELDLSSNNLPCFGDNIELFWSRTLRKINLSGNRMTRIPWSVCRLENLYILDLSKNAIESLPLPHYWQCKALNKLNLSHNKVSSA